jgi:histidinol-phosphate phosphatase family protein
VIVDATIVIPTIGRESLHRLIAALTQPAGVAHPRPAEVIVVDDRRDASADLRVQSDRLSITVLRSGGRGPAAARNLGWRAAATRWVAFLDDDVLTGADWLACLADDLNRAESVRAAGSQGGLLVPAAEGRRATDDERRTQRLATAQWITADMAFRRDVLVAVGGFDERFPRAYREDSDIALRMTSAGHRIVRGDRRVTHPVAPATTMSSVRAQIGNRDNALMRRKFGRDWRSRIGEGPGRMPAHVATTVALATGALAAVTGRPTTAGVATTAWAALTTQFAVRRFLDGPPTVGEAARLALTSMLIPPVAVWHRMVGEWTHRSAVPEPVLAVLLDRDDTIIEDGPFLNDPNGVRPLPGAVSALNKLRERGILLGIVSNQSGVARGLITPEQLLAVNAEVDAVLGPFDTWQVCVHDDHHQCACRKPRPGMVLAAAETLGVPPERCVMIGDTGGDVNAALAAKARAVLVPTDRTRVEEIQHARSRARVAATLTDAVSMVLRESR